jgi:hypothetical protein
MQYNTELLSMPSNESVRLYKGLTIQSPTALDSYHEVHHPSSETMPCTNKSNQGGRRSSWDESAQIT